MLALALPIQVVVRAETPVVLVLLELPGILIKAVAVEQVEAVQQQLELTAAQVSSSSKQTGKPMQKIYKLYGIDTAMAMLRPGAKWEISNSHFTRWDDPRPCPTWEEVQDTMEKIKAFEDSINTIYTEEQMKQHNEWVAMFNKAAA